MTTHNCTGRDIYVTNEIGHTHFPATGKQIKPIIYHQNVWRRAVENCKIKPRPVRGINIVEWNLLKLKPGDYVIVNEDVVDLLKHHAASRKVVLLTTGYIDAQGYTDTLFCDD